MNTPLLLALVAGALSPLNPCGVPLLPAFLSFYVGAEEDSLPQAVNRIAQALVVGLLVTTGFLGVFVLIGVPITYGAGLLADALPWAGLVIGLTLLGLGLIALAGYRVALPVTNPLGTVPRRHGRGMLLFGAGYGIAALGCTLPTFLALVGVSLGASNATETAAIFAAYGVGMALSFMTLSLIAALFHQGLSRALRRLAPSMSRISGALLAVAGAYLAYYWSRILFASSATLATDPVIGPVTLVSARFAAMAADRGLPIVLGIGIVIAMAIAISMRQRLHRALPR